MKSPESSNLQGEIERVASSLEQTGGESALSESLASPLDSELCMEALHDLNNVFAAVLMNAQVLDGKLPSYSRSKRYIHEIERSAQRGGALIKRLLVRLAADAGENFVGGGPELARVPPVVGSMVVASQGPTAAGEDGIAIASSLSAHAAPVFGATGRIAHSLAHNVSHNLAHNKV